MTKRKLMSNFAVADRGLDLAALRNYAQNNPREFARKAQKWTEEGTLSWKDVRDLRSFFNAFSDIPVEVDVELHGKVRTITSSAFPVLSGNLTIAGVNAAFDGVPTIGQDLAEDFDSAKESVTLVGLTAEIHQGQERKEGEPYPLVGAGEERFEIGSNPKGLRMQITQETIDRNEIEGIVQKVNFLGRYPAGQIEKTTLREVTDHDGSAASGSNHTLILNKTGTALYSPTANVPGTRAPSGTRVTNNALVDTSDLEAARTRLATMKDEFGERRALPSLTLLVPHALEMTAETILGSTLEPGVANQKNAWGPQGSRSVMLKSSPKLDDLSASAWYLGDFKAQFKRKWGLRLELVSMSGDLASYLRSRIAFEARVAWDCKVGASDYGFVVQCLAGTTAPKDA